MKKAKRLFTVLLYIILISFIASIIIIKYFSYKIKPSLNKYITSELERIITLIINDTINNDLTNIDTNNLFIMNDSNSITSIDLNNKIINSIQKRINNNIENNIRLVSRGKIKKIDKYFNTISDIDYEIIKGGTIYYIASGNISGSIFTNNLGPKIPIKFSMSGHTISSITSKVKEYGINNALIEVRIKIKVNMIVDMPYVTKTVTVKTSMPIATKIIQGFIPEYYIGNNMH